MKNKIILIGSIVFITIIGFSFTACPPEEQYVEISGTTRVGQTITATANLRYWDGNFSWELSSTAGAHDWGTWWGGGSITGANSQNYEITSGAVGRYIRAYRRTESGNVIYSNVLGPIQAAN